MNSYKSPKTTKEIAEEYGITIVPASELSADPEKVLFPDLLDKANQMLEKSQESLKEVIEKHKPS